MEFKISLLVVMTATHTSELLIVTHSCFSTRNPGPSIYPKFIGSTKSLFCSNLLILLGYTRLVINSYGSLLATVVTDLSTSLLAFSNRGESWCANSNVSNFRLEILLAEMVAVVRSIETVEGGTYRPSTPNTDL